MIGIDFNIDTEVKCGYISNMIHSDVQNTRKEMGLRPWNDIEIILDTKIKNIVNDLPERLEKSLDSNVKWNDKDDFKADYKVEIKYENDTIIAEYIVAINID